MGGFEIGTALARESVHGWKLRCGLAGCEMSSRNSESFGGSRYARVYLLLPNNVSGAAGSVVSWLFEQPSRSFGGLT